MTINLDDILDFSFLSLAIILSFFIDNINQIISSITYEFLSNTLSLAIQFMVLLGLIYKMRKFKKK
jgi:TRAP-type mannitol/chloroaromatic compound transport system permease large subunit|tara:strand:- start:329 stop:526 length:198 start_codon:yes stop_codon:yes gene_type:complete